MTSARYPEVQTLRLEPSFGFGDRTGLATPGHVAAMRTAGAGIRPIFPQQSIREMMRTGRSAQQVMDEAIQGMRSAGWTQATGADADHLKTTADIDVTHAAGFCFYTLDPSACVDVDADHDSLETLRRKLAAVTRPVTWMEEDRGRSLKLSNQTQLDFNEEACLRAAVKYGQALHLTLDLANHLARLHRDGAEYEVELSVDETPQPTTLVEHYIVADQCLRANLPLVSLAPRFPGDFEKGVDFKGDRQAIQRAFHDHAAIARTLGPYKLSLHSGSDKLSIYTEFARATEGRFHVKTAGTSYLEALRVAAHHDEPLFREIIDFSRSRFDVDKATYHLSATLAAVPPPAEVDHIRDLETIYLERWEDVVDSRGFTRPGRQILHCTFGSVLTDARLGKALHALLAAHADTYEAVLCEHFARHLRALTAGM